MEPAGAANVESGDDDFNFHAVKRSQAPVRDDPSDAPHEEEDEEEDVITSLLGKGKRGDGADGDEEDEADRKRAEEEKIEDEIHPIPMFFYLLTVVPFFVKGVHESLPGLAKFYFFKVLGISFQRQCGLCSDSSPPHRMC